MAKKEFAGKKGVDLSKKDNEIQGSNFNPQNQGVKPDSEKVVSLKPVPDVDNSMFAIPNENYKFMAIAFGLVILGFVLMSGGEEDIYSFRKITLSVLVCMSGFVGMIYAIMRKPAKSNQ